MTEDYPLSDRNIQQTEAKRTEEYNDMPVYNTLEARYIRKNHPFEKVVDEFVLNTYYNIDEQEFQVCKEII